MRKYFAVLCCAAVLLLMTLLPLNAMAEEELSVIIHDPIRMSFDVLGGSGSYEVVSATLSSGGSVIVSTTNPPIATPNGLESGNYYLCTITVRDVATGEVATGTGTERYFSFNYEETWDCNKSGHDASEYDYEIEDDYENSVIQTGKYFDITETHHSVRVIKSYRCVRCSTYMYSEETVVTSEHKYGDNGLCSCGAQKAPACLHTNTSVRDGAASRIMVSDNADQHKLEQIHETYCLDCGRVVSTSTDTEWENHTFNDKGYCVCGYYKAPECRHINTTSTCVGNSYTPHEVDPYLHWEMPEYKITCLDCGYVSYETWPGIPYPHEFDKNGKCIDCGFQQRSPENIEPLRVTISDWYSEATVGMSIGATAQISGGSGDYECHWIAFSDQHGFVQTSSNEMSWGINAKSEGTWQIKITVYDVNTGITVSATTRAIRVISVRDKYISLLRQYTKWENPLDNRQIYDLVWQRLYPHFGAERTRELIQIVSEAPADYRTLYLYTLYDYDIFTTNLEGLGVVAYYDDITNGISFRENDLQNEEVLFHEIGHAIDSIVLSTLQKAPGSGYQVSLRFDQVMPENLAMIIRDDVKSDMIARMIDHGVSEESAQNIARAVVYKHADMLTEDEKKEMDKLPSYYDRDDKIYESTSLNDAYANVSDVYGGATGNYILGDYLKGEGHKTSYWEDIRRLPLEFWAHYFSARLRNDKDELSAFYGMLPQACKALDVVAETLAGQLVEGK